MKLFQKLLITPAVLGLLTPLAGSANELNFSEVSGYSSSEEIENIREFDILNDIAASTSNLNEIEPMADFEAGSFSETTTMSGSASFQVGAVDGAQDSLIPLTEALTTGYSYKIDLNTSFTGDDNLYVGIETGNHSAETLAFALDESVVGNDTLTVSSMYYKFPLGNFDAAVGPLLDADDLMPTSTSKYSDSFFFGSQYGLDTNYFAKQGTGSGFAVARSFDNGWNASGSVIGTGGSTASGILTNEGIDVLTLSLGYDADNYGGGIVYQNSDSICALAGNYAANICNDLGVTALLDEGYTTTTIGAYYIPTDKTTLSATSSFIDPSITGLTIDTVVDLQFAIDRKLGDGTLSASWKSFPFFKVPDLNETVIQEDALGSFVEVYYTYDVNDSLSITPGIAFTLPSKSAADLVAEDNDLAFRLANRTAIGVGATFKF